MNCIVSLQVVKSQFGKLKENECYENRSDITKEEINKIKSESKDKVFIAEIDGDKINCWEDYWAAMSKLFSFPELPAYMKPDYHS